MTPLFRRETQPVEFGEGAVCFLRQGNTFDSVQLGRCRSPEGQALRRSLLGCFGAYRHGGILAQAGAGLKRMIRAALLPWGWPGMMDIHNGHKEAAERSRIVAARGSPFGSKTPRLLACIWLDRMFAFRTKYVPLFPLNFIPKTAAPMRGCYRLIMGKL
jgi:hypothetical protein